MDDQKMDMMIMFLGKAQKHREGHMNNLVRKAGASLKSTVRLNFSV